MNHGAIITVTGFDLNSDGLVVEACSSQHCRSPIATTVGEFSTTLCNNKTCKITARFYGLPTGSYFFKATNLVSPQRTTTTRAHEVKIGNKTYYVAKPMVTAKSFYLRNKDSDGQGQKIDDMTLSLYGSYHHIKDTVCSYANTATSSNRQVATSICQGSMGQVGPRIIAQVNTMPYSTAVSTLKSLKPTTKMSLASSSNPRACPPLVSSNVTDDDDTAAQAAQAEQAAQAAQAAQATAQRQKEEQAAQAAQAKIKAKDANFFTQKACGSGSEQGIYHWDKTQKKCVRNDDSALAKGTMSPVAASKKAHAPAPQQSTYNNKNIVFGSILLVVGAVALADIATAPKVGKPWKARGFFSPAIKPSAPLVPPSKGIPVEYTTLKAGGGLEKKTGFWKDDKLYNNSHTEVKGANMIIVGGERLFFPDHDKNQWLSPRDEHPTLKDYLASSNLPTAIEPLKKLPESPSFSKKEENLQRSGRSELGKWAYGQGAAAAIGIIVGSVLLSQYQDKKQSLAVANSSGSIKEVGQALGLLKSKTNQKQQLLTSM